MADNLLVAAASNLIAPAIAVVGALGATAITFTPSQAKGTAATGLTVALTLFFGVAFYLAMSASGGGVDPFITFGMGIMLAAVSRKLLLKKNGLSTVMATTAIAWLAACLFQIAHLSLMSRISFYTGTGVIILWAFYDVLFRSVRKA